MSSSEGNNFDDGHASIENEFSKLKLSIEEDTDYNYDDTNIEDTSAQEE